MKPAASRSYQHWNLSHSISSTWLSGRVPPKLFSTSLLPSRSAASSASRLS
jgi:hypothetical protein